MIQRWRRFSNMKYDFTTIMDRRGKDAIAVDLPGKGGGFAPGGPKEGLI